MGNTAQLLCANCAVRFFVRLAKADAGISKLMLILAYFKEVLANMTKKMQARRTQEPWYELRSYGGSCVVLPKFIQNTT